MHTNTTAFKIGDGKENLNIVLNSDTARHLISMVEYGMQKLLSDESSQFYISVFGSSIDSNNMLLASSRARA
jgi:hypothetical protein